MKMKSQFTRRGLWIGGMSLFLVTILTILLFRNTGSFIATAINQFGPQVTEVETRVDAVYLNPLTGSASLRGFFLGNPKGYESPSAVEVSSMSLKVVPSSLTTSTIVLDRVDIESPVITWEGSLSESNLSKIEKNLSSSANSKETQSTRKVIIRSLRVENAILRVKLKGLTKEHMEISLPTIDMKNIGGTDGASAADAASQVLNQVLAKSAFALKQSPDLLEKGLKNVVDGLKGLFKK